MGVSADTAFCVTLSMGVARALLLVLLSPLLGSALSEPELVPVLAVLAVNLPLRSLGLTHYALAQRGLEFRARAVADVAEIVVRGAVSLTLALAGLAAWSLVLGYLSGTLAWTVALWVQVHWRPRLRIRRSYLRPLFRFGGGVTAVGIVGMTMGYVDNLFVGGVLGSAALGIYALGYRLPETLIVDVVSAAGLVLFPTLSLVGRPALKEVALTAIRYLALITVPAGVVLVTLADPLVLVLFGHRWAGAVPVVQLLSIAFVATPIGQVAGNAYLATKRVSVMVRLAVPQGILLVTLIAIFVNRGYVAVAACQAGVRVLFVAIGVFVSTRVIGFRLRELWQATWAPLLAAAGMSAVTLSTAATIQSPLPCLIVGCLLGLTTYVALIALVARNLPGELWRLARASWGRRMLAPMSPGDPRELPAESHV